MIRFINNYINLKCKFFSEICIINSIFFHRTYTRVQITCTKGSLIYIDSLKLISSNVFITEKGYESVLSTNKNRNSFEKCKKFGKKF